MVPGGVIPINPTVVPGGLPGRPPANPAMLQAGMAFTAAGLGALKTGVEAGMGSQADANKHIAGIVDEMERARTSYAEVAALRSKESTAGFVAGMARSAGAAGISEQENVQFRTAYEAYAGQFTGNKLSPEQADRLQQKVAAYSVGARHSRPRTARLLGTIVNKSKGGATDNDILDEYARSMQVMSLRPATPVRSWASSRNSREKASARTVNSRT